MSPPPPPADTPPFPVAELSSLSATLDDVVARLVAIANTQRGSDAGDALSNELYAVESALRQGTRRLTQLLKHASR